MQALLEHFITQSVMYSLIAVALVAFLESLALVGLILPGTVMMAGLGALIGSGEVNFWQAWLAGIIGCLLGDWISFWLGWRFKKPLHRWSFMKKNKALLDKTEHALHQHSMFTILVGRFVGPTRPLVPMVAGMLDLPVAKFVVPNIIGCVFWPPFYFLPGILAGAAIDIPDGMQSGEFKWLLLGTAVLLWLAVWLCWRLWRSAKASVDRLTRYLPRSRLLWLAPLTLGVAVVALVALIRHPLMPVYGEILLNIFSQPTFERVRGVIENDAVNRLISRLLHQHVCQHGDNRPLTVGHDIDNVISCYVFCTYLKNQIRQALCGKELVNPVRIRKNRMGKITIIRMQRYNPCCGRCESPRAWPQHIRNIGCRIRKGAAALGIVHIKRVTKIVVLVFKRPLAVITQIRFFLRIILLVSVERQMCLRLELADFIAIALLICAVFFMRYRLIAPVKRDNRRAARRRDFLLRFFIVRHDEVIPFMRVHICPVKPFI